MLISHANCCEIIRAVHGSTPRRILHIGAHIGEEAAAYQEQGAEQVIWFEANADLIPRLEANIGRFAMKQQIVPVPLWHEDCELEFKVTNNMQSSSFFDLKNHAEYYPSIQVIKHQKVPAYRLDTLFDRGAGTFLFRDFDFVNIDTQGAELAILKGMGRYLSQASLKAIYLEVNREELYDGIPLVGEIDEYLRSHGFHRVKTSWTERGWGDALYLLANSN